MSRGRRPPRAAGLLLGLGALSCARCGEPPVAELEVREGAVDRDHGAAVGRWEDAPVGTRFALGDAIRTGAGASALVGLRGGSRARLTERTVVRFLAAPPDRPEGARLRVEAGEAELLSTEDAPLVADLVIGLARLEPGSRVRLAAEEDGAVRLVVELGLAMIERAGAAPVRVAADEAVRVEADPAEVVRVTPIAPSRAAAPPGAAPPPTAASAGADEAAAVDPDRADGLLAAAAAAAAGGGEPADPSVEPVPVGREPPPTRAHLAVPAGEDATVYDPKPGTAVRVDFAGLCPGGAVVEVAEGGRFDRPRLVSRGERAALISLRPGRNAYRVRCLVGAKVARAAVAEGALVHRRAPGTARLPSRPARNVLDADGRRYTVVYQTLLPELVVRWREAPADAGPLTLHVDGVRPRTVRVAGNQHRLASGEVPEGRHRFWFEGAGGVRSPTSDLRVAFDNASPSAYLQSPPPQGRIEGEAVAVAGAALEDARVSVGGVALALDEQRRFEATVPVPFDLDAVAIRIAHDRSGVQYYVRRITPRPR